MSQGGLLNEIKSETKQKDTRESRLRQKGNVAKPTARSKGTEHAHTRERESKSEREHEEKMESENTSE